MVPILSTQFNRRMNICAPKRFKNPEAIFRMQIGIYSKNIIILLDGLRRGEGVVVVDFYLEKEVCIFICFQAIFSIIEYFWRRKAVSESFLPKNLLFTVRNKIHKYNENVLKMSQ